MSILEEVFSPVWLIRFGSVHAPANHAKNVFSHSRCLNHRVSVRAGRGSQFPFGSHL